jgi:hypothetical protein
MDRMDASEYPAQVEAFSRRQPTGLVTLVFTDIVESTALKQHWEAPKAKATMLRALELDDTRSDAHVLLSIQKEGIII